MVMTDPIADMLTRIRNAIQARKDQVDLPASRLKLELARLLKAEGFIKNFKVIQEENRELLKLFLKYDDQKKSVIEGIEKISTPGRRVYVGVDSIPLFRKGMGVMVLSTNKGLMTDENARKERVGGEILCKIW